MRMILLNPGPVTLSAHVRAALAGPDLCHREPEFAALQGRIRQALLDVYALSPADWATVLLTGSGTAAVEAMLTSLVPTDGHLLVIENGVYGERMTDIARRHGIRHSRITHAWLEAPAPSALEAALAGTPGVTHVAVVHHETTSGRLNNLSELAACCTRHGAELLIDGVSSFGAEEIDFERWPVAGVAATANKCLHGVPGTCFVMTRRESLARGAREPRTVYLDLHAYLRNQDAHGTPFTQSVQTFYALDAALDELRAEGGWRMRRQAYRARIGQVRDHLVDLGVAPLLPDEETSCVLHAFRIPEGLGYPGLHDVLKADGFIIYAGQSTLAQQIFRISTMGDITAEDLTRLRTSLTRALSRR